MADEQPRGRGEGPDGSDETRQFSPFDTGEPAEAGPPAAPDETAPMERTGGPQPDETAAMPPMAGDATRAMPPVDDGTAVLPPAGDATAPLAGGAVAGRDRMSDTAPLPPAAGAWSGRAEVRPPAAAPGPTQTRWVEEVDEPPRRPWWTPILLGIVVLLLLGLLGAGIWLIAQAGDEPDPTPTPSPPTPTAPATSAPPPTTAPPTTPPPSPEEPAPVTVAVPALVGLSSADARSALDQVGLTYRLTYRPADAPEGTVVEADPPSGTEVPEGTQITLVLASALPTTEAPQPSPPETPGEEITPTS